MSAQMDDCDLTKVAEKVAKTLVREALEELAADTEHIRGRLADSRNGLSGHQVEALVERVQDEIDRHYPNMGI